ncbi:MAG: gliding motility protein GldL [Paludibacteraceae bacterium]|nr:gliding motility protein GldL [Paludibacteraceae bacterium]
MGKFKKNSIEKFLSWEGGQRLFNFAYSIGAAIVILGALFKLLHLPYGNLLLTIGMGTEVLMFVLTAFDRPPREYKWEEVFPVLDSGNEEDRPDFANDIVVNTKANDTEEEAEEKELEYDEEGNLITSNDSQSSVAVVKQKTVLPSNLPLSETETQSLTDSITRMAAASEQLAKMADLTTATQQYLEQMSAISEEMNRLKETTQALNNVSDVLLKSYQAITENSENITQSSTGYVEQMQDLNRNIGGLNTIYEIQLKSVSSQLDSIDRVNRGIKDIRDMYEKSSQQSAQYCEETEKMARYMKQLNSVYEKMITAMTINMYRPMMGGDIPGMQNPSDEDDA